MAGGDEIAEQFARGFVELVLELCAIGIRLRLADLFLQPHLQILRVDARIQSPVEAGCDFKVIAGWLGHKDGGVLVAMTYGHLRSEHSTAMAKRITFDAMTTDMPDNVIRLGA